MPLVSKPALAPDILATRLARIQCRAPLKCRVLQIDGQGIQVSGRGQVISPMELLVSTPDDSLSAARVP